jgi:hypothetical protein
MASNSYMPHMDRSLVLLATRSPHELLLRLSRGNPLITLRVTVMLATVWLPALGLGFRYLEGNTAS